jgi:4-hydroxy-tetrahydrodipicolinate reductase
MKIALLGYGKMGKVLEEEAEKRGHSIALKINSQNAYLLNEGALKGMDLAIEFSNPQTVLNNIYHCFDAGVPVVVGTTGWLQDWNQVVEDARCRKQALFYASNFSLGVNLFFQLNTVLARMMKDFPEYNVNMVEVHHRAKKDSPSGTALSLAESLLENLSRKSGWVNYLDGTYHAQSNGSDTESLNKASEKSPLEINSFREDPVPGIHEIHYTSEEDEIVIKHSAKNRRGFALGAIFAGEWIQDKSGIFTMKDLIGF